MPLTTSLRSSLNAVLAAPFWIALAGAQSPTPALTLGEIAGNWRILSYVHEDGAGAASHPLGKHPSGYLVIGSNHRCTLVVTAESRKPAEDEKGYADLVKSMIAYSAPCTGEADGSGLKVTLRPDVAWNPTMTGSSILRFLSLKGHELTVRSPPSPHGTVTARFERAR